MTLIILGFNRKSSRDIGRKAGVERRPLGAALQWRRQLHLLHVKLSFGIAIQESGEPVNGPRPAIGKPGRGERLRGEVFAAQGVAWTAEKTSFSKSQIIMTMAKPGVEVCGMQAMTQVHCQGSQLDRRDHTLEGAQIKIGTFYFGSKYLSIGSGGVIGPLEGVESTVGSRSEIATSTAVTWLTHFHYHSIFAFYVISSPRSPPLDH